MTDEITVSVTDLARFCHRRGDIDHRFIPSPTGEQGIAGHQRLYARRPASYCSEYPLEHHHSEPGVRLLLRGRADGYDREQGMVEEIKTCRVAPATIPEAVTRLHLAQGRLYAALITGQDDSAEMEVRLTWFNIDTDEEHSLSQVYSREELASFLADTLARFSGWLQILSQLRQQRDTDIDYRRHHQGDAEAGQHFLGF